MTAILPDDKTLLRLEANGLDHKKIAAKYGVSRQAVSKRMASMGNATKGINSPLGQLLPWDISKRPDKRRLSNQGSYTGLRYFLRKRMGEPISTRGELACAYFLEHIARGEVVVFDDEKGFIYLEAAEADGSLVVRWPTEVTMSPEQRAFFKKPKN